MSRRLEKRKLLFMGELPPRALHGISIANERILNILAEEFTILHVLERRDMGLTGASRFGQVFRIIGELCMLAVGSLWKQPHLLYTTFPTSISGAAKCLLSSLIFRCLSGGQVILHVHRGDLMDFAKRGRLEAWLLRASFAGSSRIIALSTSQAAAYSTLTNRPICVIPNTADVIPEISWVPESRSKLIFLSNYLPGKGLDVLLEACKELRQRNVEVELHCYGGGDPGPYQERVERERIPGVHLHGVLKGKEKFRVLSRSWLMAFPSNNEGQPLVVLEAMALGLPVVASRIGLIPEMLGENYPFLVPPGCVEDLASKIQELLQLSEAKELSRNLQRRFEEHYSLEILKRSVRTAFGDFEVE